MGLILLLLGALTMVLFMIAGKTSDLKYNIKEPIYYWLVGFVGGCITAALFTLGVVQLAANA